MADTPNAAPAPLDAEKEKRYDDMEVSGGAPQSSGVDRVHRVDTAGHETAHRETTAALDTDEASPIMPTLFTAHPDGLCREISLTEVRRLLARVSNDEPREQRQAPVRRTEMARAGSGRVSRRGSAVAVTVPKDGRTVSAHVEQSLERAEAALVDASYRIQRSPRLSKAKRIELWRELAGVVSDVESVRLWLEGGAPK